MAPAASQVTVGEVRVKSSTCRSGIWMITISLTTLIITCTSLLAYYINERYPAACASSYPWWLVLIVMWGFLMALFVVVPMFTYLFLPLAPMSVVVELVSIGFVWMSTPLIFIVQVVIVYGHAWMFVAQGCVLSVLIAGLLAFWACLVLTYNKPT